MAKELGRTNTLIGTALRLLTEQDLSLGPSLDTMVRVLDVVNGTRSRKAIRKPGSRIFSTFTIGRYASRPGLITRRRR